MRASRRSCSGGGRVGRLARAICATPQTRRDRFGNQGGGREVWPSWHSLVCPQVVPRGSAVIDPLANGRKRGQKERSGGKYPFEIGGGGVWMNPTIDIANRQVIFGTGNPNPDFHGEERAGDNLHTCSVVSLDADTGKLRWAFQEVRHDNWDYDQAAVPILFTSSISGQLVEAV